MYRFLELDGKDPEEQIDDECGSINRNQLGKIPTVKRTNFDHVLHFKSELKIGS